MINSMLKFKNYLTSRLSIICVSQISSFLALKINQYFKTATGDIIWFAGGLNEFQALSGAKN
jgi:hypothetical protein